MPNSRAIKTRAFDQKMFSHTPRIADNLDSVKISGMLSSHMIRNGPYGKSLFEKVMTSPLQAYGVHAFQRVFVNGQPEGWTPNQSFQTASPTITSVCCCRYCLSCPGRAHADFPRLHSNDALRRRQHALQQVHADRPPSPHLQQQIDEGKIKLEVRRQIRLPGLLC